ncbi:lipoprotein-releasing ABC transporter permease subunit [Catenovulum sp. SM1970]|uniref:lipoprotein-releasing ABC transporter permease subunit n=1 Tax=Marinifaba aquimaris TaxID=2741323 RepID=UPI001571E8FE|nr:lipoprotein-releasing ABC transporter permease subunit [Marinifaba aquimaris]NTS77656.1 lipoprotein-releasing ABC transporter permease subunit [Marinifaba aquimaris]
MFYPLSFFIASRYSRSKQAQSFIAFITFFSVAGITLGVAALITVISVMNGFEGELKKRILGVVPHILIAEHNANNQQLITKALDANPQVKGVTPFLQTPGMLQSSKDLSGVAIQGIYPDKSADLALIAQSMIQGRFDDLTARQYQVIVGRQLALKMGVKLGDKIRLLITDRVVYTPMGRLPVQRNFTVTGIYDSGSEVDGHVVITHINDLARLLKQPVDDVSELRVYLNDAFDSKQVSAALSQQFPDVKIEDWRTSQGKLFAAVKMEKNMMWLMLCLIIAVAAFNIVSALVMVVTEKQGEIATLKTLGLNAAKVQVIFLLQGLYKGVLGAILGTALGLLLAYGLNDFLRILGIGIFSTPGYSLGGLPIIVQYQQVAWVAVSAIGMSLLATLYPAYRAANTKPAHILRYE